MKKSGFIIILSFFTVQLFAQNSGTLVGGMNISTFRNKATDNTPIAGWFAGFQFSKEMDKNYYLKAVPQFTQIGSAFQADTTKGVDQLIYLKLPVHIQQRILIRNQLFYFEAGPYAALSAGGKEKIEGEEEQPIHAGGDVFPLNTIDFGLGASVGTIINTIELGIGVDYGIQDIHRASKFLIYNRVYYFSIGFNW